MKKAIIALLLVLFVAGAGLAWWFLVQGGEASHGAASPKADAADISFDWFLTEGELTLGTEDIRTPIGVNVLLQVDSDSAEILTIKGLGVKQDLLADQMTPVHFNAYKLGRFDIMLKGSNSKVGTLEIYSPTN